MEIQNPTQMQRSSSQFHISACMFILFAFLLPNSPIAQNQFCDNDVTKAINHLYVKYSRLNKAEIKTQIDSLIAILPDSCNRAKIESKFVLGRFYKDNSDFDKANSLFNEALVLAENDSKSVYKKHILTHKSIILHRQGESSKGVDLLENAYNISCHQDSLTCLKYNLSILVNKATIMLNINRYDEAIDSYLLAEQRLKDYGLKDSMYRVSIYNGLGNIYQDNIADLDMAIEFRKKTLQFVPNGHSIKYKLYNNLGNTYKKSMELDSSIYYFNKTISASDNPRNLVVPNQGIGDIKVIQEKYEEGIQYYKKAVRFSNETKNLKFIESSKALLGKALYLDGQFKESHKLFLDVFKNYNEEERIEYETEEMRRFELLNKVALYDSNLSNDFYTHLLTVDSINSSETILNLEKSASKYEALLLRDSLARQVLLKENEAEKVKNYRLSTALLIVSLLLLGGLVYLFRKRFLGQKIKNETLVFQNQELIALNKQLELRATSHIEQKSIGNDNEISIKSKDKTYFVPLHNIKYMQAEDDGVRIYYDDISKWSDISLVNMQKQLDDSLFVQIFRGTIVNINHIAWINTNTLKMKSGAELKIGRTFKPQIKKMLES